MKNLEDFYRKYANMPIKDRGVSCQVYFGEDDPITISPQALYRQIKQQDDFRREHQLKLDRLLKIASKIMK